MRFGIVGVLYHRYHGSPVMVQKSGYDLFPSMASDWGTKHLVPDTPPPILAEEEKHQPKKN
jgi:hypothetical protein